MNTALSRLAMPLGSDRIHVPRFHPQMHTISRLGSHAYLCQQASLLSNEAHKDSSFNKPMAGCFVIKAMATTCCALTTHSPGEAMNDSLFRLYSPIENLCKVFQCPSGYPRARGGRDKILDKIKTLPTDAHSKTTSNLRRDARRRLVDVNTLP